MSDYRNVPLTFLNKGLNVTNPPEALEGGQLTRAMNLRVSTENVAEARQGTKPWAPEQKQYFSGGIRSGPLAPYPTRWDLGRLRAIRYIGKIKDESGAEHNGYITVHDPGSDPNNNFRVFINGTPLVQASANCAEYTDGFAPFIPRTFSIIRTTAKNGKPIVIFDGAWYVSLQQCVLTTGQDSYDGFDYGLNTADVPVLYAYKLGITAPSAAPGVSNSGSGNLNSTLVTAVGYIWRYSYYSSITGFESPLSLPSTELTGANFKATLTAAPSEDPQVTHVRWYRLGGTLATDYRLVDETQVGTYCGGASITYDDTKADADILAGSVGDTDSIEPFTTIDSNGQELKGAKFPYAFGPFVGKYLFWVGDPVRPGWIYWNNAGDAGTTDPLFGATAITDPAEELLNGFIFGGNPFVWSSLRLYALDYGGEGATPVFVPREIPLGYGLAGRWAFAVGPNTVFFVGRDGIYATSCQGEEPTSITDEWLKKLFRGDDAGDLEAVDFTQADELRLSLAAKNLHFFYKGNSGAQYHLVFDIEKGRWLEWTKDQYTYAYLDESSAWAQTILGVSDAPDLFLFDDSYTGSQESFTAKLRTNSWDAEIPLTHKEFGVLMLDFDPNGAEITITPYYDSETVTGTPFITNTAHDKNGRRVKTFSLGDVYAKNIALDFQWTETPEDHPIFYQGILLFRADQEEISHWEVISSAMGNPGYFHLKYGFITYRSNGPLELIVEVDGKQDKYELASTSGARKKLPFVFRPRRGRLFRFIINGKKQYPWSDPYTFRLYGDETVFFAKPWVSGMTYKPLQTFTEAGYAEYLRNQGGT